MKTDDPVQLTKELVGINSVNPFRTYDTGNKTLGVGNEAEINSYIESYLQAAGFDTERQIVQPRLTIDSGGMQIEIPERWNVLAEKGSGPESVMLFGHSDTVDVGPGWETSPFEAISRTVNGRERLLGLGANDMKAGLAAILCAASRANPSRSKCKIAIVVDEEFWSFGAEVLAQSEFVKDVRIAICPEIGEGDIPPHVQAVGLGRLGRAEFEFSVQGRSCHGADALIDSNAVNAVHESARLQVALQEYCLAAKKEFSSAGIKVMNSAYISSHKGGEGMLRVPAEASFLLERTLLQGETAGDELGKLENLVERCRSAGAVDPRAEIRIAERKRPTPSCRPYFFPAEDKRVQIAIECIRTVAPEIKFEVGRSVADENRLAARNICTLTVGPNGAASHTPREWVDVESIRRLAEIFRQLYES